MTASALTLTISGIPVELEAGSLDYTDYIGQRSTGACLVRDDAGTAHYSDGQPWTLYDTDGTTVLYAGVLFQDTETWPAVRFPRLMHNLQLIDFHWAADKRYAAVGYTNMLAGDMVSGLVTSYLAAEGISGAHFARTETTTTDFSGGTLVRATAASNEVDMGAGVGAMSFARASSAYLDTGASVSSGAPRYPTGATSGGHAITIEEGTTNLLTANQGSVETDTTGFSALSSATLTKDATHAWVGSNALKVVTPGSASGEGAQINKTSGISTATPYTASVWVWATSGNTLTLQVRDVTNSITTTVNFTGTGGWQRVTATVTTGGTSVASFTIKVLTNGTHAYTFWCDGFQLEALAYATSWVDGGSTRAAETLSVPSAAINVTAGTVGLWLYTQNGAARNDATLRPAFYATDTTSGNIGFCVYHLSGTWVGQARSDLNVTSTVTVSDAGVSAGAWHHFALTWDTASISLLIDGVNVGTATTVNRPTAISAFTIGYGSAGGYLDTQFDDLFVSQRRLSDAEVATLANGSAASSSIGGNTSYYAAFDSNLTYGYGGYRLSPTLNVYSAGIVASSKITWHKSQSGSATSAVQTSLDGGVTWSATTSGSSIPGLTVGVAADTAGYTLIVRQVFTTTDSTSIAAAVQDVAILVRSSQIADGPTIVGALFNYAQVSACLDAICQKANYFWWIDPSRRLWFQQAGGILAPFDVSGADMTEGTVQRVNANPTYRNREYITGVPAVTTQQTETRKGDGVTRTYLMSYPLNSVPTISTNIAGAGYVAKTVGVLGVDTGKDFYWSKASNTITQDSGGTLLTSSDLIKVIYYGQYTAVVQADDLAGQVARQTLEGIGTGIVADAQALPSGNSTDEAYQLANALLSRYSVLAAYYLTFETLKAGLAPGQLCTITHTGHDIIAVPMLIESVEMLDPASDDGGGQIAPSYKVKALAGPVDQTWVDWFTSLQAKNTNILDLVSAGASTTLTVSVPESETWTWTPTVTETAYACPIFPMTFPFTLC